MCGRYSLTLDQEALSAALQVPILLDHRPRYNLAPTQEAPVLVRPSSRTPDGEEGSEASALDVPRGEGEGAGRWEVRALRWGLVPHWAEDPSIGNRLINARAETAHAKPAFRTAFRYGRCLVLADGFYEWRKDHGGKTPFWIHRPGGELFTFAGIRARWRSREGESLESYAILTTDAPEDLRSIHPRVPVVVEVADRARWMDPDAPPDTLAGLLGPPAMGVFRAREVSTRVNSPTNDDPECAAPVGGREGVGRAEERDRNEGAGGEPSGQSDLFEDGHGR